MKVQLLVPPGGYIAQRWSKGSSMPHLGFLSIGAVLERAGHTVQIVPSDILKMSWGRIKKEIRDFKPDLLGVTTTTENRFQSFKLIKLAKKIYPQALTILGGPHASMAAEDALTYLPELDIAVRGEGEMTMLEICGLLDKGKDMNSLHAVEGISLRLDGKIKTTRPRTPIQDLDSLPFSAFHLIPFQKYNFLFDVPGQGILPGINIMTSRGCPFHCNFCATPINWGQTVRMRSPQNVISEIETLTQKYGARVIFFSDDTFNANPRRVEEICDLIVERKLDIFWKCDIRIDLMDKPLLEKMKEAGLFHLSFGLEAGSERVRNDIVNKKIHIKDFYQLIDWCLEMNIIPNTFFIFSHPTETWEEAKETIRIIEQYKDKIESSIAILHIYPGTPLEKKAKELGALPENFSWTRKSPSKIITLPLAQGDVPLFLDKLSWSQISELVFRWTLSNGDLSIFRKMPRLFVHIRSWADIKRYATMASVYFRLRMKKKKNI